MRLGRLPTATKMTKEYYQAHKAEIRAKQRAYLQTPEARSLRRAVYARYDKTDKAKAKRARYDATDKRKAVLKRYDDKRRITEIGIAQNKAHKAVRYALLKGRLTRMPCAVCGGVDTYGHHHRGYAVENWLEVKWLCMKHHMEEHGK